MDPQLHRAAINGSQDLAAKLNGVDSNRMLMIKSVQKNTILHVAAKSGKLQIADDQGGDHDHPALLFLYEQNAKGNTPLHIAARLGHLEMTKNLVIRARKTDVERDLKLLRMVNLEKDTALHEAVRHNRFEVVKLLLEEDQDLASLSNNDIGESPLFVAVDRCFHQIAFHIIRTTPNCSYSGRNGMNVLHAAVIRSQRRTKTATDEEALSLFLRNPCIILQIFSNIRPDGKPLEDFVHEVLSKLQSSTLLEEVDNFGWTPLHYASNLGNTKLVELFLDRMNNNKSLARDKEGMTALHISAKKGHVDVIRTLMNKCPDICELLDENDRTALHVAVESREQKVVQFFLQSFTFQDLVNEKDKEGNTALHMASAQGDIKILGMLANDSNIDKGATNNEGMAFVDIILSNKKLKDIEILEIMLALKIDTGLASLEQKFIRKNKEAENEQQVEEKDEGEDIQKQKVSDFREIREKAKNFTNVNLLIATIIAAATFAAVFAVAGQQQEAKELIKTFLQWNTVAFVCSTASMLIHFIAPLFGQSVKPQIPIFIITVLTGISLSAMVIAFEAGLEAAYPGNLPHGMSVTLLLMFPIVFLAIMFTALFTIRMFRTARRKEPHNKVRSHFLLWS